MMLHSPTLHRRLSSWLRRFCALSLALAFVLGFATPLAASGSPAKNVANGSRSKKQIALTFDVEHQANLSSVLSTLKSTNTPATFFVLGSTAERYPQVVPSIRAGGHELANHTYSHNYLTTMSHSQIVADLQRAQRLLEQQAGGKISNYFRPPYGSYNAASLQAIGAAGFSHAVLWDVDPRDWSGVSADRVRQEVLNESQNGSIVLFHIQTSSNTYAALPGIISGLKQQGYELVTVSTLLGHSQPGSGTTHTVRAGDSWWSLGIRYGVNYVSLAQANGRKATDHIYVGERLIIPTGQSGPGTQPTPTPTPPPVTSSYTVQSGDTLWAIALRYKTTVQAIVTENKLANPNVLRVGQVLRIPGQSGSTPAPTPSPDPTPTPTPTPTPSPSRYTVRAGDTMWGIARNHNVSLTALINANNLANPNVLVVGQQLTIPGGTGGSTPAPTPTPPPTSTTVHTVRAGDTLWDISRRYGVTVQAIVNANNMSNANLIRVGQRLTIPR